MVIITKLISIIGILIFQILISFSASEVFEESLV
jgi:hypothetical protein